MSDEKNKSADQLEEQLIQADENGEESDETLIPPYQENTGMTEELIAAKGQDDEKNIELLVQQIESHKRSAAENLEKAMRAQAELDNMRKRTARDIENAHKYSLERFVNDLLPVIDSMELGLSAAENTDDIDSLREGMDLTYKMFSASLEKFGVKVINPQGEKFNPELHQAVTMQEVDGEESGNIINVMQKGYELNGRLIRPAMVIVAK